MSDESNSTPEKSSILDRLKIKKTSEKPEEYKSREDQLKEDKIVFPKEANPIKINLDGEFKMVATCMQNMEP
jgi:uncharacterized protein YabE (DUF348 family)